MQSLPSFLKRFIGELDRAVLVLLALLLVSAPSMLLQRTASAAQVTSRSLAISTAQAGATATYTFTFTPASTSQIQSLFFQTCTTALGTCTAPAGVNLSGGTVSQSGFQGATSFTTDTVTTTPVSCTTVSNLCVKRTDVTAQTLTAHTVTLTGATNQNSSNCSGNANCTFFVRITTYSDNAFATAVDSGTVASSTTQLFTVNAAIQETLDFCIGATTINDGTTAPPACSTISGTSLNLGTLGASNTSVSPVPAGGTTLGDANNGIAELSTNAVNGTTVAYAAILQSGTNHTGTLRVAGATCNAGSINTDQCIDAQGVTKGAFTAGTEKFGMTIAAVNCAATTAYTCSYAGGTYKLVRATNYNATGADTYTTDSGLVAGTTNAQYAWDESGTSQTIASSTTVVDKEALILKFASTPNIVTPTGSYTAKANFVATPTY